MWLLFRVDIWGLGQLYSLTRPPPPLCVALLAKDMRRAVYHDMETINHLRNCKSKISLRKICAEVKKKMLTTAHWDFIENKLDDFL